VIFIDRYGPKGPPSLLRACYRCDAMGCYPVSSRAEEATAAEREAWAAAEAKGPADDGWHFIRCADCRGSARISWLSTLARFPSWLAKGTRVFRQFRAHEPSVWVRFKICFLYDLGLARR